jgi:aspartyl-tRNA(Asn)/glutamyl-tRNA(Gln) amidotransferase subunit A
LISPKSLADINLLFSNERLSLFELTKHYIKKIEESKSNAFIEVYKDEALDKAITIDKKIKNNTAGLLAGVVVGIKDNTKVIIKFKV